MTSPKQKKRCAMCKRKVPDLHEVLNAHVCYECCELVRDRDKALDLLAMAAWSGEKSI